ncbi:uncharacterized protein LOC122267714 [Penaeus japonicus]|uniref:uncharacterized protein LOC122267714 n=1 Tax=Penaeus japonicus TaxID=27405 RepID=UPI001C713EB7|nr:uncharacterized protein LOC122267714 [Penaeus japonicus]
MAAAVSEVNLKPRQVTRLRREEEEESWISGEELYTEGSSEDEGASSSSSAHAHARHIPQADHMRTCPVVPPSHSPPTTPPSAASEPAQQNDPHLTDDQRLRKWVWIKVEEQEEVMLKTKRGIIASSWNQRSSCSSLEQVSG